MVDRNKTNPTQRVTVSADAATRNVRQCGFALLEHFLRMHQVFSEHLQLQPIEVLILLATTTGNVQRVMRSPDTSHVPMGAAPLPPDAFVPMSRRAIARVTGLPTETVRRHVDSMIERGLLVPAQRGVLAPSRLAEPWVPTAAVQLLEAHARCTEQLIAAGAISAQPARSARAARA